MRQANVILQTNKDKSKTNETVPDSSSNIVKSITHHNQTKEWITWFLNLPLDESIDNKMHKIWISNPRLHEAHLEDTKSQEKLKTVI
jgi:hypothetical protein